MKVSQYRFLTYHPFVTFSGSKNYCFYRENGKPCEALNEDTGALFGIGKEAYRLFQDANSVEQFNNALKWYRDFVDDWRSMCPEMVASGKLVLQKSPLNCFDGDWNNLGDDVVIGIAWNVISKKQGKLDEDAKAYLKLVMALHTLIEIDNSLLALNLHASGAVVAACEATKSLSNLLAIQSGDEQLRVARSVLAYQGAVARIERDPKQKEKTFIHGCWQRWRQSPETYTSKAAFARDMLSKCEHLTSQKKIEDWCREWETETGIGTQPAE